MGEHETYAVFLHSGALEALGEAIKPYLSDGPAGTHIQCTGVDTGGAFCEMKLTSKNSAGKDVELELMVPTAMIRLIVSITDGEGGFGFA
ncbi:hypothetical protein [Arenimonas oryziterrae]|uniref:Uncharacterized protein n=1 Tax=Arenimonas oryziterrae DSM 21050 = YC6267 TaxID=1121015 RepID=A0A091AWU0_9GAMM|nr:hypothetical protein [Arenimonas oryziterrae]KFN44763.1 hypothetical protein N789_01760 [Arenimonas oryziterrae DSM 21050 = YC6267]